MPDPARLLVFIPRQLEEDDRWGKAASGLVVTETPSGHWISPGPEHDDWLSNSNWWRSTCGHAVEGELAVCPVCGEARPAATR